MFVNSSGQDAELRSDCAFAKVEAHCPLLEKGRIAPFAHQRVGKKLQTETVFPFFKMNENWGRISSCVKMAADVFVTMQKTPTI